MKVVHQANHRFWRLLKSLLGKKTLTAPNQPISFMGKVMSKSSSIANNFRKQYVNILKFEKNKDIGKSTKT